MIPRSLLLAALLTGPAVVAAPFDTTQVAQDTKWLAHLDVDRLKTSELGQFLIEAVKSAIASQKSSVISLSPESVIAELHSITAYGLSFDETAQTQSVLLLKTGPKAQSIIDGYVASMEASNDGKTPFKALTDKGYPTYLIGNEVFMAFPRKDLIIISKKFTQVESAMSVIQGRSARIDKKSPLLAPNSGQGFFFVASANGLENLKDMPPQARILQKATGLQLALGESSEKVNTRISLTTSDAESSSQLRRIIDGMIALVSLAQVENESLSKLTQSITVEESERNVSLNLSYPVEDVKKLLAAAMTPKNESSPSARTRASSVEAAVTDAIGGSVLKVANVDARTDNGNLARNATDGNPSTYWGSTGRQQWIRCELESQSLVREVQIAWFKSSERATKFSVQTSTDGVQWKTLASRTSSTTVEGPESINIPDTATRWVRILCNGSTANPLNAITELTFLGEPRYTAPAAVATSVEATAPPAK